MKIAILVSGDFREFKIAHRSWPFKDWKNIDYYFSIWNKSIIGLQDHTYITEEIDINLINYFNVIDKDISPHIITETTHNAVKMLDRIKTGLGLILKSRKNYDIVVIIRPDLFLNTNSDAFFSVLKNVQNSQKIGLDGLSENFVQDVIMIFPFKCVNNFYNWNYSEYIKSEIDPIEFSNYDIHKILFKYFKDNSEVQLPLNYNWGIVRNNARALSEDDQLNYSKIHQKSQEWWETRYGPGTYCNPVPILEHRDLISHSKSNSVLPIVD